MAEKTKNPVSSTSSINRGRAYASKPTPSSSIKTPASCIKEKSVFSRTKFNKNITICEADETSAGLEIDKETLVNENNLIDYGKFLRNMLEECLIDEKIQREETQMETQILHLADRFNKAMDLLDRTSQRLQEILFVIQQRRLLDSKKKDCAEYYASVEKSNAHALLDNFLTAGQNCLDTVEFRMVDFGYDNEKGFEELLKSVEEVSNSLDQIKKHKNLDDNMFKEYKNLQILLHTLEKYMYEFQKMDSIFKSRLQSVCHKIIKETSNQIAMLIESDEDNQDE